MSTFRRIVMLSFALLCTLAIGGPDSAKSKLAWDQFKSLVGTWNGKATDGRKITLRCSLIAADSVLMVESWFDAHPGEKMVTMHQMDGERLTLVHYCVAKNQPRLAATEISDDGKKVLFTFVDGGNISSRDKGHMDKAAYRFIDKNHFSDKWTWYQSGKEQWMEEFVYERGR